MQHQHLGRRYFANNRENTMTVATIRANGQSVFDAGLPVIDYEHAEHPDEAHAIIREARLQAPIAIGPHGPELLTYELVHAALRDQRFRVPQGMFGWQPLHLL
jgi:hypothetical protein